MPSRPRLRWADLAGARVGVWGLGVEGMANLRRLQTLGATPVPVDDRPGATVPQSLPVLVTAQGGAAELSRCDVVVKTPGISRYRPDARMLAASGVPLVGGLGLWLEEVDRAGVVCITGTKGKSTTTTIVGHLLGGLGQPHQLAGNIGRPPGTRPTATGWRTGPAGWWRPPASRPPTSRARRPWSR